MQRERRAGVPRPAAAGWWPRVRLLAPDQKLLALRARLFLLGEPARREARPAPFRAGLRVAIFRRPPAGGREDSCGTSADALLNGEQPIGPSVGCPYRSTHRISPGQIAGLPSASPSYSWSRPSQTDSACSSREANESIMAATVHALEPNHSQIPCQFDLAAAAVKVLQE